MTDAKPDPLTDETTPTPEDGPEYVVTPTLRAFGELLERVEHLEASSPALDEDPDEDEAEADDPGLLTQQRLTRHRTEIEAIKKTLNGVIEFLRAPDAQLPAAIPAAPTTAPPAPTPTAGVTP